MDPQPAPAPAPMSAPAPVSAPVSSGSYISAPHLLVKPGWEGLKPNLGVYLGTYLAIIAVVLVVAVIGGILTAIFHWLGLLIGLVIAIIGFLALARLIVAPYRVLLAAAKREKITFNQATTSPEGFAVRFLLTGILLGLILVVGFVLLIIPGLWLLGRLMPLPFVMAAEGLTGTAALKRTWELTRGRYWEVAGALGMVSAVQVLNLVPILGPIATIVVSVALAPVTAERYLGFVWLKNQPDQNVPVDKSNYWWLLGFVAAGIGGHASYRPGQS